METTKTGKLIYEHLVEWPILNKILKQKKNYVFGRSGKGIGFLKLYQKFIKKKIEIIIFR